MRTDFRGALSERNKFIIGTGAAFLLSLVLYLICLDPGASLWDCPEYILSARGMEITHPPGNPTWQIVANVAAHLGGGVRHAALAVNLLSAVAMAASVALMFQVLVILLRHVFGRGVFFPSIAGALCFAWCDSAIFSAVEAEVYSLSLLLTILMLRLSLSWAKAYRAVDRVRGARISILLAYLGGLGMGVHELNLLVLPAIALVVVFAVYRKRATLAGWVAIASAIILMALILYIYIPGLLNLATSCEIWAVNSMDMPFNSGAVLFIFSLFLFLILLPPVLKRFNTTRRLYIPALALLFFTIGLATFLVIPLRSNANTPVNPIPPSHPAAFAAYYGRDQYGETPLLYGRTPYSKPLLKEERDAHGSYSYTKYALADKRQRYNRAVTNGKDRYEYVGTTKSYIYPDELNVWFPRMTSTSADDIDNYAAWAGMTPESMTRVKVKEALDSSGKQTARFNPATGVREPGEYLKPTFRQQLRYTLAYQVGYMYFRYLLWNFSGRQNNIPSTGEIDHGNFLTGFAPVDNLMLGDQSLLPETLSEENRGHNRYFMLPFIAGVFGAIGLCFVSRRGRRVSAVITALFLMTGLCIVVYLNQAPGEPRERDYAFLGSYMAFALWIGAGLAIIWCRSRRLALRFSPPRRLWLRLTAMIICAGLPLLILSQTYDDHDRGGRDSAGAIAGNILNSLEPDAVIFANGDNIIFPLWYAQEVLGLRPDVSIVAFPYLGSEEYWRHLMIPTREAKAVVSDPEEAYPGRREAAVRKIIEMNWETETIRPIYFSYNFNTIPAIPEGLALKEVFAGTRVVKEDSDTGFLLRSDLAVLDKLKSGITQPDRFMADPTLANASATQRSRILGIAERLLEAGKPEEARRVTLKALSLFPFDLIPPRRLMTDGAISDERLQTALLLENTAAYENLLPAPVSSSALREETAKLEREFTEYWHALPPGRRSALSSESKIYVTQ